MNRKVKKIDAAEEQLKTAISLYFADETPVSVHTLAMAAHEILDQICAHKKLERGIVQKFSESIKSEKRGEFWQKINEAKNFFKHARSDPDPEVSIEWNTELASYYIFDSITLYQRIKSILPCEFVSFFIWFRGQHPGLWEGTPTEFSPIFDNTNDILSGKDKKEAYQLLMNACKLAQKE